MNVVLALLVSLGFALVLAVSNALMKVVSLSPEESIVEAYAANYGKLFVAVSIYFAVFCAYPFALRFFPMSIIFPAYTGMSVFLVMLTGAWYFNEPVSPLQYVGAGLLVAGVALITFNGGTQS